MNTENNNGQNNDQQGKEAKKINAAFESNLKKIIAVVGGTDGLKPVTKVPEDQMAAVVKEFFKEETEQAIANVKEGLKTLLKGHVEYNKAVAIEKKKFEDAVLAKKKQFNAEAVKLFNQIDGIANIEKDYYIALGAAGDAVANGPVTVHDDHDEEEEEEESDKN